MVAHRGVRQKASAPRLRGPVGSDILTGSTAGAMVGFAAAGGIPGMPPIITIGLLAGMLAGAAVGAALASASGS